MATRAFYRIVKGNPPTLDHFLSYKALGLAAPRDPERLLLWDGVSVSTTKAQARAKARHIPSLGSYIAEIQIADDLRLRSERSGPGRVHFTLRMRSVPVSALGSTRMIDPNIARFDRQ